VAKKDGGEKKKKKAKKETKKKDKDKEKDSKKEKVKTAKKSVSKSKKVPSSGKTEVKNANQVELGERKDKKFSKPEARLVDKTDSTVCAFTKPYILKVPSHQIRLA
jgi:hypothetical protein